MNDTQHIIVTFESIVRHEYFLVIYGVILWFTILYSIMHSDLGKKFTWKAYWKEYKDEFAIAMILAPLIVVFDDEMLGWYNDLFEKDIAFGTWFYLSAGMIGNVLITAVKTVRRVTKMAKNANNSTPQD